MLMAFHAAVDAIGFILHNLQNYVGKGLASRCHNRRLRYLLMRPEKMKSSFMLRVFFPVRPLACDKAMHTFCSYFRSVFIAWNLSSRTGVPALDKNKSAFTSILSVHR